METNTPARGNFPGCDDLVETVMRAAAAPLTLFQMGEETGLSQCEVRRSLARMAARATFAQWGPVT